jgi:cyclopropane fatty-acyl-phospholipid synthase-like methyltransferase
LDQSALDYSRSATAELSNNCGFSFIKVSEDCILKGTPLTRSFIRQDIIYSVGLMDYLEDNALKACVRIFFDMLKPGGKFIFAHKNKDKNFSPLAPAWLCGWIFIYRNKDEITSLIYHCGASGFSLHIDSDAFNDTYFFTIIKQ